MHARRAAQFVRRHYRRRLTRGDFIRYTLEKYLQVLFKTDANGELDLEEGEAVLLRGINSERCFTHFHKTIKAIKADIEKYKHIYNLYIGLATVRGEGGTVENMRARQVLMLDFDRKDYPELKTAQDCTTLIKAKVPQLFVHMIVDTGHGYHAYIAINRCVNIERVTAANRALAEITGADLKATSPTQIARIPTSFNLKDDDHKPVTVVSNAWERSPTTFKRYNLQRLEGIIERIQQNEKNLESISQLPATTHKKTSSFHCVEAMLAEGAAEGSRNFCLGRIVAYLKTIKGYTQANAASKVKEWNRRCRPPKPEAALMDEFTRYWEGNYKLLGCELKDQHDQAILNHYCDKFRCTTIFELREDSEYEPEEMYLDNAILKDKVIRDLTGFHYLILSILSFVDKPLTKKKLIEHLTGRRTKKCCISAPTLRRVLSELIDRKYITYDEMTAAYSINRNTYQPKHIKYSYAATIQLVNKIITPCEYLTYLCLVRNLQNGDSVTHEMLAENLQKQVSDIGKYVRGLHVAGLLNVTTAYNERGVLYNHYKILY